MMALVVFVGMAVGAAMAVAMPVVASACDDATNNTADDATNRILWLATLRWNTGDADGSSPLILGNLHSVTGRTVLPDYGARWWRRLIAIKADAWLR